MTDQGEVVRPALLRNDTRSAPQAAQLIEELGGPDWVGAVTGRDFPRPLPWSCLAQTAR